MEVVAKLPAVEQRDSELKQMLKALGAFRRGEGGVTLPTEWDGLYGKIAAEFNELTAQAARNSHKLEALEPGALHRADVDEHVLAATVGLDKSEALLSVEPLNRS